MDVPLQRLTAAPRDEKVRIPQAFSIASDTEGPGSSGSAAPVGSNHAPPQADAEMPARGMYPDDKLIQYGRRKGKKCSEIVGNNPGYADELRGQKKKPKHAVEFLA